MFQPPESEYVNSDDLSARFPSPKEINGVCDAKFNLLLALERRRWLPG